MYVYKENITAIYIYVCVCVCVCVYLPWWLSDKESTCQAGGFYPWVGKGPWRRTWQPTSVFLPGKSHGQRSLVGYSPWGYKELDMKGQLTLLHTHTHTYPYMCVCVRERERKREWERFIRSIFQNLPMDRDNFTHILKPFLHHYPTFLLLLSK